MFPKVEKVFENKKIICQEYDTFREFYSQFLSYGNPKIFNRIIAEILFDYLFHSVNMLKIIFIKNKDERLA